MPAPSHRRPPPLPPPPPCSRPLLPVRTIQSQVFASRYSLRFPRVTAVRGDKAPADANSVDELDRLVAARKGGWGKGCVCVCVCVTWHGCYTPQSSHRRLTAFADSLI